MTAPKFDGERIAWLWLMALPRVQVKDDWSAAKCREVWDRQIKITACPGDLQANQGAPLVHVSILLPGLKTRVHGSGNDLYAACDRAQHDALHAGYSLPFLAVFEIDLLLKL